MRYKYFPKPTFVHINEDGGVSFEYIRKDNARLNVIWDSYDKDGDPATFYIIYTGHDGQYDRVLTLNSELVEEFNKFGLEAKE